MKDTGIRRRLDDLGRLVLPVELRQTLAFGSGASVAFFLDGERLVLRPHEDGCVFCDRADDLVRFSGHEVCRHCIAQMPRRDPAAE